MTKRMGLMALGLSMALLSGCGSSDDIVDGIVDDIVDDTGVLNTPAVVEKNIVGSWKTGCDALDLGLSESSSLVFNADGTGAHAYIEYDGTDCNPADEADSGGDTFTYKIGEATVGSAGEDAVELDVVLDGGIEYYTMIHFTSENTYMMADDDDDTAEADTPETRENIFDESDEIFTRQ